MKYVVHIKTSQWWEPYKVAGRIVTRDSFLAAQGLAKALNRKTYQQTRVVKVNDKPY